MSERAPQCPDCGVSLAETREKRLRSHFCEKCSGIFLDPSEQSGLSKHIKYKSSIFKITPEKGRAPRPCPKCENSQMKGMRYGKILVDFCSSCRGIWLDNGELQQAVAIFRNITEKEKNAKAAKERREQLDAERRARNLSASDCSLGTAVAMLVASQISQG